MKKVSAGLLMYRWINGALEVLLAHPGGPFFTRKDMGVWSIPKGEIEPGEEPLDAAIREFGEETGFPTHGPYLPLHSVTLKSGKRIHAWAFVGDCDPKMLRSNRFQLEWPSKSGKIMEFPEVDRAGFFKLNIARQKIHPGQLPLIEELSRLAESGALVPPPAS